MSKIKLETIDNTIYISTPYNADFVSALKRQCGGSKWEASTKRWKTSVANLDLVRQLLMEYFGYTDLVATEEIAIKITAKTDVSQRLGPVELYNKVIARAFHRDSGAKLGPDVTLLSGKVSSGGSRNNWETCIEEGSSFIVRNVSKTLYERNPESEDFEIEVVSENEPDFEALRAEKAQLLKRLEEVEKLLSEQC